MVQTAFCEPWLSTLPMDEVIQFERLGYYRVNQVQANKVTAYHRVVGLKDTWSNKG
jgi:glutaminyl-tRNA synthetase